MREFLKEGTALIMGMNMDMVMVDIFMTQFLEMSGKCLIIHIFPIMLQNQTIFAGLEVVLSSTEKSCITSYYRQLSTKIKMKFIKLIPVGPWN